MSDDAGEVQNLRRCVRDLVALTALPAAWSGLEPKNIAENLADTLLSTFWLDLIYIHLKEKPDGVAHVAVRAGGQLDAKGRAHEIRKALDPLLRSDPDGVPGTIENPIEGGTLQILCLTVEYEGNAGVVVTGSRRTDFPTEIERLLVGVAANQAAVSMQEMGLLAARRKAEQEARESRERLVAALAASGMGTFHWSFRANTLEWDDNLARLCGLPPGQTVRSLDDFLALVHADDRGSVLRACARCRNKGADIDREFRVVWPDGTVHWLYDKGKSVFDEEGRPLYMTGACVDITQRKRVQIEIEDLNVRMQRAMAESHHRIKNNLQVLAALVDLQRMNSGEMVPAHELLRLSQHIRTLASLHDLLTAEARTGGDLDLISLKLALEKLVTVLQGTAGGRQILVQAEEIRMPLKQGNAFSLLVNELISNAIKHGRGDIHVRLKITPLLLDSQETERTTARLEVCDNGPGFPSDFDPQKAANTGLDLIQSMGRWDLQGQVVYENRQQGGACVVVTFPVVASF